MFASFRKNNKKAGLGRFYHTLIHVRHISPALRATRIIITLKIITTGHTLRI